ncbi:MAG: leucine-rich repeat domain-containing protein [Bergeyella sp.]
MKKILFFLLISNFAFAQWSISEAERSALISLYNTTNGAGWSQAWDFEKDPKNWYGIKTKNGFVTEINLRGNVLSGNFPANLSVFSKLEKLDLSSNNLTGEISGGISGLTALTRLDISHNRLSGDPSLMLSSLSNLEELSLGNNQFSVSDINGFLQNFINTKVLDLANFGLTAVPQRLSAYNLIESLNLQNNSITDFSALSGKTTLKELNISGNQLSAIPSAVSTLPNLTTLNLSNNAFTNNNLSGLANLTKLEWLSLEKNQLSGVPTELAGMAELIHLNLGRNLISGGLSALQANQKLQQLYLNNNLFENEFPAEILQLEHLQMLSLVSNNLSGNIPSGVPALTFLENNKYTLAQLGNFLQLGNEMADFTYSPQRYDEPETVYAPVGGSISLTQSLSGDEYQYSWFRNLGENIGVHVPVYSINSVEQEDYAQYTMEAYYLKNFPEYLLEVSFFREPITLEDGLGTEEINRGIGIYPNPTTDFLNIRSDNMKVESSAIYDLSGKLLFTSKESKIDVKHLPSGVYMISLKTEQGFKTFKWIKH